MTSGPALIGGVCLRKRALAIDAQKRVEHGVCLIDAPKQPARQFDAGQAARGERVRELGDRGGDHHVRSGLCHTPHGASAASRRKIIR